MKKPIYQIIFLGPQSSGKGTQAELLAKKLKLPVITIGNIYREHIKKQTILGRKIAKFVNQGKLVPDQITNQVIVKLVKKYKPGFILDGYPRNLIQANFLDKVARITNLFEITLSNKEAIRRISGRRSCVCGEVYHLIYRPPKKNGICDKCGKKLYIREDDQISTVKKRLKIYRKELKKLLNFYQPKKVLIKIDGRPAIKKIHQTILKKLYGDYPG